MRWHLVWEQGGGKHYVNAFIEGRIGLGHATHKRFSKAVKLAQRDYLKNYPLTTREALAYVTSGNKLH